MSVSVQFYLTLLLVYVGVNLIACWGLNLQMGVAGILNFGFVLFQAAGAYAYALFTLGPVAGGGGLNAGYQVYLWGTRLPFPIPFLAAIAAGGGLAALVGVVVLPRLRGDYQAVALLVVSLIGGGIVLNNISLLNGASGLSGIPKPLAGVTGLSGIGYSWFYVALTALMCLIVWYVVHQIGVSPFGRTLRAIRESEAAARSLGKDVKRKRLIAFIVGGALGGLSGGVLVGFINAWAPASWGYQETFVFVTVIIIGGFGSNLGVAVGVILVPIIFGELPTFLPQLGQASWLGAIQLILYGALTLGFLWFRPRGIVPEKRISYSEPNPAGRGLQMDANVILAAVSAGEEGVPRHDGDVSGQ